MPEQQDLKVLRDLAKQYADIAAKPVQEERRKLWSEHYALKKTRPLILASFGMHNVWCREVFSDDQMKYEDPFLRGHERSLRMSILRDDVGDDCVQEPWFTQPAAVKGDWSSPWGVDQTRHNSDVEGGAWQYDPPLRDWADMDRLVVTGHEIDEELTKKNVDRLGEAIGDILPIDVPRGPFYSGFGSDISTHIARLRGLETLMMDMYEYPDELHQLLAFMRDGILAANQAAEDAGDYSLTTQQNQAMTYAEELERPAPMSGPRKRSELWGFCAAQEFALISPEFHDEFMLQYQMPIYNHFGLIHYGCCEDLGKKIDILRQMKNLRSIGVGPTADVTSCAEQIGKDYTVSWRPNPTDMVCCGYSEQLIRKIVSSAVKDCEECAMHIHLKDVETLEGDTGRLKRWVKLVREITDS